MSRLPGNLISRSTWKASEWRNVLIYYGMFIFKGFLPEDFYKFFYYLVALYKKSITFEELFRTIKNLELFIGDFERLYGVVNMSFNVTSAPSCLRLCSKFGTIVGNFLSMDLKIQMVFSLIS